MFIQKKWFVLFAALFLGLAAELFAPEGFARTANAETVKNVTVENKVEGSQPSFELVSAENVWKQVYMEFKYGEMTEERV